MDVKVIAKAQAVKPFPKLMVTEDGDVVLFAKPSCGITIQHSEHLHCPVGEYNNDWNMSQFSDFEGEVTLSN